MSRVKDMKRKTVQDEIFKKSQELFQQKGYDAVTIDEICMAVGISKPTFYAKKLTKRTLLLQAYQIKRDDLPFRYPDFSTPLEAICFLVDQVGQVIFGNGPELFGEFLKEHLRKPALEEIMDPTWNHHLIYCIQVGQREGSISDQEDPQRLAQAIYMYLVGYSFQYAMGKADNSTQNLHEGVAALLLTPIPPKKEEQA